MSGIVQDIKGRCYTAETITHSGNWIMLTGNIQVLHGGREWRTFYVSGPAPYRPKNLTFSIANVVWTAE